MLAVDGSISAHLAVPTLITCVACGAAVAARSARRLTCSERCKSRMSYLRARERGEWVAKNRARNRLWAVEHRCVREPSPWARGAPACDAWLPGAGSEIVFSPEPRWPIELRNTRHLHGFITAIMGEPHAHVPAWVLVPWHGRSGWAVFFRSDEVAERLCGRRMRGSFFGVDTELSFRGRWRVRSPKVERRGRQRVRLDAVTPVCVREGTGLYTAPTVDTLINALCNGSASIANRLGWLHVGGSECDAQIELIERHTQAESVIMGGKYGTARGWVGHVELEINAPARWLLDVASVIGLGGRTAFGFGRVRVTDL